MSAPIRFDRKPYTVTYFKDGVKHTIRRTPPPKLHDMMPKDIVELTQSKNDDWQAGDDFKVKGINPRHPNVLQIENGSGEATFVDYYDLKLEQMVGEREGGVSPQDLPINNRYLLWP